MIFWFNLLNRVINKIGKSQTIEQGVVPNFRTRILTMYNGSGNDLAGQFTLLQFRSPSKTYFTKLINTCTPSKKLVQYMMRIPSYRNK